MIYTNEDVIKNFKQYYHITEEFLLKINIPCDSRISPSHSSLKTLWYRPSGSCAFAEIPFLIIFYPTIAKILAGSFN